MSMILLLAFVVGVYFMLKPNDAYSRFGISYRNQIKYLIVLFSVHAVTNLLNIITAIQFSIFPGVALVFLIINILVIKHYVDSL